MSTNKIDAIDAMEETLKNTFGEETVANDLAPTETIAEDVGTQTPVPPNKATEVPAPNNPTSPGNNAAPPTPTKAPTLPGVANESLVGKGNSPQEVRNANGELVGHVSNFGGYNRFTSADGNKVFWTNSKGEKVEAPKSMQMMDAMNAGLSPNRGFRGGDWDQTLQNIKAQGGIDAIRAQQYKRAAYDALTLKERQKKKAEYDFTTADAVARAWVQINNGYGDVKQSKDGNFYRIVRFSSNDGYGPVVDANKQMEDTGRKSRLRGLIVAVRTDAKGNILNEKERPIIKMQIETAGGINGKSPVEVKDLDLGRVMNQHANSFAAINGVSEDEARNNTYSLFGTNPLDWKVSEGNKVPPELQKAYMEVALKEKQLKENARQFDAKLSSDEKISLAKLGNEKAIALSDAYIKMSQAGGNIADFLKSLPDEFKTGYFMGEPLTDGNGNVVVDDATQQPMRKPLSQEEYTNKLKNLLNIAHRATVAMGYQNAPIVNLNNPLGGFQQAQGQGGGSPTQAQAPQTPAEKAAAEKAKREAAKETATATANNEGATAATQNANAQIASGVPKSIDGSSNSNNALPSTTSRGSYVPTFSSGVAEGVNALVSLMNNNANSKGTNNKQTDLQRRAQLDLDREAERRAKNGQQTYAARKNGTLEKPVKEISYADTPLAEIPGKAALDIGKGARRLGGKLVDGVTSAVEAIRNSEIKALREAREEAEEDRQILKDDILEIANATPRDVANAISTTAHKVKAHASAFANRIKGNLAEMDAAAKASRNDPKTKDRNAFYANRDGRSGERISPLRWINEKLDVFRKDNSYKDKKLVDLAKEVVGEGKKHTLAVIREVMKADGIDTSDIYPGIKAGDAIFEKIYKLSVTPERPKLRNLSKDKKVIIDPSRR